MTARDTRPRTKPPRRSHSERLLRALDAYEHILVVTHDNPDPDAIAAGWALLVLIRKRLGRTAQLVGGGDIVRAENRHLVKLLQPPIELVTDLDVKDTTAAVLVDCSAVAENHLLAKEGVRPVAVIDHHVSSGRSRRRMPFRDVRPSVAAAASIAASYLREQAIVPSPRLATALSYAIRTETRGGQFRHGRLDRSVLRWLVDYANPEWIAEIESAPLSLAYFGDLARALASAVVHGTTVFCLLPRASGAETVGEMADLIIRGESIQRVLCAAIVGGDLVVSVRTERGDRDASALVRATLEGLGGGGGHAQRAGGKVSAARLADRSEGALAQELERRWLTANGIEEAEGRPLVVRTET